MSCSSPLYLRHKKTHEFIAVPCGHCYACLTDKREQWADRLRFDMQYAYSQGCGSSFCTWTYDDNHYPLNGSLNKDDAKKLLRFLKREVDYHEIKTPWNSFHYYLVGEYGGKIGRPHMHAIVVGVDSNEMKNLSRLCWKKGFSTIYPAETGSIRYVLKYLDKQSSDNNQIYIDNKLEPPFAFMSRGIGKKYLEDNRDFIIENGGYRRKNTIRPMPAYYKRLLKLDKVCKPIDSKTRQMVLRGDYDLFQARKALDIERSYVNELRNSGKPADDSGLKYLKGLVAYLEKKQVTRS